MASVTWNAIDEYSISPTETYCAFLDILGYKIKSERFFEGSFNLEGRFKRALKNAFATFNISSICFDASQIKVDFFSDSIIINAPKIIDNNDSLFGIIQFSSLLAANLSFEDLFIRGGIASGPHIEKSSIDFKFLSSQALQKAYQLESIHAKNPRILLCPTLISNLSIETRNLIIKEDTDYLIHYALNIINKNGDNLNDAFAEMNDILNTRNSEESAQVKEKYQWILDYYYWTVCQSSDDNERFFIFTSGKDHKFSRL